MILPEAVGSRHGVQAFLVRVRHGDGTTSEYVVASAHHPRLSDDVCESLAPNLRSHFNDACVCFTTESDEGSASVLVPSAEHPRFQPMAAAAAVATTMRVCGWDESATIQVHFRPSGEAIRLSPRLEAGEWVAYP